LNHMGVYFFSCKLFLRHSTFVSTSKFYLDATLKEYISLYFIVCQNIKLVFRDNKKYYWESKFPVIFDL
ncbi:MAG: hypothetical protein E7F58_10485, partial [Clostridium saudiense]|uniref:hypothetical protein n=1 Tax=Clostridium saudiense TaxID=1414720 RepID=UPI00290D988F